MSLGYRKLGRDSAQRKALLRDLVTDLIINGRIETTLYKAKELQKVIKQNEKSKEVESNMIFD